ncbi:hypothetical protein JAO11_40300, partial [Burkholderia cepacia]|nr:hypothetical protein [Burkholderia cepacia]
MWSRAVDDVVDDVAFVRHPDVVLPACTALPDAIAGLADLGLSASL